MTNFIKTVKIGTQKEYSPIRGEPVQSNVFCKISYKDKKLSITGVVGPYTNGNCAGSCGQIYDSIEVRHFAAGWDKTTLEKFVAIWREWHLNDMNACTLDMKAAGWGEIASKEIFKWSMIRTDDAHKEFETLQKDIIAASMKDEARQLSEREKRLLASDRFKEIYAYEQPEAPEFMQQWIDYQTKKPKVERKTLGWVDVKEHKDGLLSRELNGEKYGCKWYFHEVPQDVIDWLEALPETDTKPAWV